MPGVRSTLLGGGSTVPLLVSARGTCEQRVTGRVGTRAVVHVSTVSIVVVVVDTEPAGRVLTRVAITATCPVTCTGSSVPGEHQHIAAAVTKLASLHSDHCITYHKNCYFTLLSSQSSHQTKSVARGHLVKLSCGHSKLN